MKQQIFRQSSDLNPIEHVWGELQKRVNKKLRTIKISTRDELIKIVNSCWKEFPEDFKLY